MNILLVATGQKCFKGKLLEEMTKRPYEFYLLINSLSTGAEDEWYYRYIPAERTFKADLRNPDKAAYFVKNWLETRDLQISGVITYLEDAVLAVQSIAKELGLPPITTGDPSGLRCKDIMRLRCAAAGLPQPRSVKCFTLEEAGKAVKEIGLPCVIKPTQMAGSIGVRKISIGDEEEISQAFNSAFNEDVAEENARCAYGINAEVIVEEYIPTYQEISCEGFVDKGELHLISITKKILGLEPQFEEISHVTPYPVGKEIKEKLENQLRKIVKALNLYSTVYHAEFRLREGADPVLIEIGARLAGGFIPQLVRLSTGVDLIEAGLCLAVGEQYKKTPLNNSTAAIRFFTDDDMVNQFVSAADRVRALPFVNELVFYGNSSGGRRGHIIWTTEQFSGVEDVWKVICEAL